jgi:uncharacterized protein YdeI (YjbR/CyaY-like superfamily)
VKKIDERFDNAELWPREAKKLREILLKSGLTEELKWGKPCYTHNAKNICIIQRMKGFLALLLFKGALLKDPDGVLEVQGPNSRSGYRTRFNSVQDVASKANAVRACVRQAIEVERAGVKLEDKLDLTYPEELIEILNDDPDFKAAF